MRTKKLAQGLSPVLTLGGLIALLIFLRYACLPPVQTPIGRAKFDLKSLETAVNLFYFRHERFPETFDELTRPGPDGSPPILVNDKVLNDPWGQRYNYDPKQEHPTKGTPLIWSNGPPDEPQRISNWE